MRIFYLVLWIFSYIISLKAQSNKILFPNTEGQALLDSLFVNYKTDQVFSYDEARDILFGEIYNIDDSVKCVYTGYTIYIDPTQSPASFAYTSANFQTEHTYPQSKGAEGQAKSDMHHLYPVWGPVNASRGNEPFEEMNETNTQRWWYLNYSYTSVSEIPIGIIDKCSKRGIDGGFEPCEDHKGNVARAMFYFYTMYKQEVINADPDFFNEHQREVLYKWNSLDPVDSLERYRNELIATYQGGYKNPFILDSTLITRAYFNTVGMTYVNSLPKEYGLVVNYPNPFNASTIIEYHIPRMTHVKLYVYNVLGDEIEKLVDEEKNPGDYIIRFDRSDLSSGIYFCRLIANDFYSVSKMTLLK